MKDLLIFPYGGNALEVLDYVKKNFSVIGFVDDDRDKQGTHKNGYKIFSREAFKRYPKAKVLAIPGSVHSFPMIENIIKNLNVSEERYVTVIHPKAQVSKQARIGVNVVILAGAVITSNAVIKNHVWISSNTVIHHDVIIEDYCVIGSGVIVAGHTKIEKSCYIGGGSNIIDNVEIGDKTLVGLGTNVISSIPPNSKIVGNPARQI